MTIPEIPHGVLALTVTRRDRATGAFTASAWGRFWTSAATGSRGR